VSYEELCKIEVYSDGGESLLVVADLTFYC
jgi:hypothetical protein